jgi:hypothetical protein
VPSLDDNQKAATKIGHRAQAFRDCPIFLRCRQHLFPFRLKVQSLLSSACFEQVKFVYAKVKLSQVKALTWQL